MRYRPAVQYQSSESVGMETALQIFSSLSPSQLSFTDINGMGGEESQSLWIYESGLEFRDACDTQQTNPINPLQLGYLSVSDACKGGCITDKGSVLI